MSNKIIHATQDWTDGKIDELVNSAPEELDTLGEIAEELDKKIDETELEEILSNNQLGKDNIKKAYAYRISDVALLSAEEIAEYEIAANADVNYGFYTLNVEAPSSLVGKEYSVQIAQTLFCVGKILAVNGNNVIVENIPVDGNGEVIGLDTAIDNLDAGVVRNVLIINDHPELGDTFMGYFNFVIGYRNKIYYRNSFSAGQANHALGQSSATFGYMNKAGYMAFAAGRDNDALGQYSFVAGGHGNIIANGAQSGHAEGNGNTIKANHGHAEGNLNTVHPGAQSGHVEGDANGVFGYASHAGGTSAFAYGKYSFAHGVGVSAYGRDSTVFGKYNDPGSWNNDENNVGTYAFTVGNGKNNDNRSNALTLDWDGNLEIAGDMFSNGKKLENYDDTGIKTELKKYTDDKIANLVNSAPETLNTLDELAKALGNDEEFAATTIKELGKKADKTDVIPIITAYSQLDSYDVWCGASGTFENDKWSVIFKAKGTIFGGEIPQDEALCAMTISGTGDYTVVQNVSVVRGDNIYIYSRTGTYTDDGNDPPNYYLDSWGNFEPVDSYAKKSDYLINILPSTSTEATIKINEYYTFTNISSLTVTLDTASTTKLDEFMFSFETPSDISAFSFEVLTDESVEIKWIKEPKLKPNYIYEVSVVNSVGVIAGTAKEVV